MVKHPTLVLLFVEGLLILSTGCISPNSHDNLTTGTYTPLTTASLNTNSKARPTTCPASANTTLVYSTVQNDARGCPVLLTNPVEHSACLRNLPAAPATYRPADPRSPTQAEMDAIPVNFPGLDRNLLVRAALKDPCVTEFLVSGGGIEGISDQPRPTAGNESVRWPPTLMGYRRINCTEMLVFFDINPSAGNVSRITVDFL